MLSLVSIVDEAMQIELSDRTQILTGVFYMVGICLTACVVDDLTLVFGFLSGVAECLITFILPSVFWFISLKIEKS
jgi:hypothetical protein